MDGHVMLPPDAGLSADLPQGALEIRFRAGQKPLVIYPGKKVLWGEKILCGGDLLRTAQTLSGCALAARSGEILQGFLPLPGGHRLGICGRMNEKGLLEISSLCLRIAHEVKGAGQEIFPLVLGKSVLLFGGPGSGKTTLLRDLIRLSSLAEEQVAVADERGEIAACVDGRPLLDVGPCTDVMTGLRKEKALPLMIRSMCPDLIAADEIGGQADASALLDAEKCGVRVMATLHAGTREQMKSRREMRMLLLNRVFDCFVFLPGAGKKPEIIPGSSL